MNKKLAVVGMVLLAVMTLVAACSASAVWGS
jgi:hypothetical protein